MNSMQGYQMLVHQQQQQLLQQMHQQQQQVQQQMHQQQQQVQQLLASSLEAECESLRNELERLDKKKYVGHSFCSNHIWRTETIGTTNYPSATWHRLIFSDDYDYDWHDLANAVRYRGRIAISDTILLVNAGLNKVHGYPRWTDFGTDEDMKNYDRCRCTPFDKNPKHPWTKFAIRIITRDPEVEKKDYNSNYNDQEIDIWINSSLPAVQINLLLMSMFQLMSKSKKFQQTNDLRLYQNKPPSQKKIQKMMNNSMTTMYDVSAEWISFIGNLNIPTKEIEFHDFKFSTAKHCKALETFQQQSKIRLEGCTLHGFGKTLAEFLSNKESLKLDNTTLDLKVFGKHLSRTSVMKSFSYEGKEKTKVIGLLPGIQNNTSLTEISVGGKADYTQWMSMLESMLKHPKLEQIGIDTYCRRSEVELIPTKEEQERCDAKLLKLVRANINIAEIDAWRTPFFNQAEEPERALGENANRRFLRNLERSTKVAAITQNKALLGAIYRKIKKQIPFHDRTWQSRWESRYDTIHLVTKTATEFLVDCFNSNIRQRYDENESKLIDVEKAFDELKRKREILYLNKRHMKRKLNDFGFHVNISSSPTTTTVEELN